MTESECESVYSISRAWAYAGSGQEVGRKTEDPSCNPANAKLFWVSQCSESFHWLVCMWGHRNLPLVFLIYILRPWFGKRPHKQKWTQEGKGAPGRKILSIMSKGADCWRLLSKTIDNTEESMEKAQILWVQRVKFYQRYITLIILEQSRTNQVAWLPLLW